MISNKMKRNSDQLNYLYVLVLHFFLTIESYCRKVFYPLDQRLTNFICKSLLSNFFIFFQYPETFMEKVLQSSTVPEELDRTGMFRHIILDVIRDIYQTSAINSPIATYLLRNMATTFCTFLQV